MHPSSVKVLMFFAISFFSFSIHAQQNMKEKDYADYMSHLIGGKREAAVPSGRVDILTDTHAYEVKFAPKWKHAVGQAIWYGLQTNKKPGIILIMKSNKERKYLIQLNTALQYANLDDDIDVLVYPDDFN